MDAQFALQSFDSADPGIVKQRAREVLRAPDTVTLTFENGVLTATGHAPSAWIARAREFAPFVAGVRTYRDDDLLDATGTAVRAEAEKLRTIHIPFAAGSAQLEPDARALAESSVAMLGRLDAIALDNGGRLRIRVIGQADATGTEETNARISKLRADAVADVVGAAGFRNLSFDLQGLGATPESDRTVTFDVDETSLAPR